MYFQAKNIFKNNFYQTSQSILDRIDHRIIVSNLNKKKKMWKNGVDEWIYSKSKQGMTQYICHLKKNKKICSKSRKNTGKKQGLAKLMALAFDLRWPSNMPRVGTQSGVVGLTLHVQMLENVWNQ